MKVAGKLHDCCVCEVGPGPGSLTRSILSAGAKRVVAVERDSRFLPSLEVRNFVSSSAYNSMCNIYASHYLLHRKTHTFQKLK